MGWLVESHRIRVVGVEVDFLARSPSGILHIIEVKSAGALDRGVLSQRQLMRLRNAASSLAQREPIGLLVLVVLGQDQILEIRPD
jgi:hypothetical protein